MRCESRLNRLCGGVWRNVGKIGRRGRVRMVGGQTGEVRHRLRPGVGRKIKNGMVTIETVPVVAGRVTATGRYRPSQRAHNQRRNRQIKECIFRHVVPGILTSSGSWHETGYWFFTGLRT
jgi:hypothetical protein